ncbi:MAG: TIGR04255 family protein [Bacteroidota bacterium]|nr:TIGR04255 family protein [Bacteroidota bacterium]
MQSNWPVLNSPPVILAIFQLKFASSDDRELSKMIANDKVIKLKFPIRSDNYHSDIDVHGTPAPGISTLSAKANTKISSYIYFSQDKERKLIIEKDSVIFISESVYSGWDNFKKEVQESITMLVGQLEDRYIERTSIRFVNKFSLASFEDPLDYFTKMISTESEAIYPLEKYAFRINIQVPDSNIRAIINNALEPNGTDSYDYYLDIDVLDDTQLKFDLFLISKQMEQIREVKNKIFFDTVKPKTLALCN